MESNTASRGMVVAPHHLATQSALAILREGGTAIEATVAAAATNAVVYPHMNSIGGDAFWLIIPPQGDPIVIEGCGKTGSLATPNFFKDLKKIPLYGPKSANTVAGAVGSWQEALNYVSECGYQRMSISKLLADAIYYAEHGFPISSSHVKLLEKYISCNEYSKEFEKVFFKNGVPKINEIFCQKLLAETLKNLSKNGLNSFYNGELAKAIGADIMAVGMPITEADLAGYSTIRRDALKLTHTNGVLYNTPPPTQGLVSLSVLGMLDKMNITGKHEGEFIHATVEATKQAFILRDKYITDPVDMTVDPETLLSDHKVIQMAQNIDKNHASPFGKGNDIGDTVWMSVADNKGFSVSFIQSIYHAFGSGVVLPKTGILWHNRGVAFSLDQDHILAIKPGKKPFHTLNPAAAKLNDGRIIAYGTRGGDGQAQTQAAIFHRYVVQGLPLQQSVSAPRWLYGSTTGEQVQTLKLEERFSEDVVKYLKDRGHDIVMSPLYCEDMGHAGAIVRHVDGSMEGAFDPRSNGSAAGF